jgi:hypothetical protein
MGSFGAWLTRNASLGKSAVLYVAWPYTLIEFSAHVPVLNVFPVWSADMWRTVSLYVPSALIPPRADTRKGVGLKLTVDGKSGVVEVGCPNHFAWQCTARGKSRCFLVFEARALMPLHFPQVLEIEKGTSAWQVR